jgi:hypothetical protein
MLQENRKNLGGNMNARTSAAKAGIVLAFMSRLKP